MGFVNENLTYRDVFEFDIDLMNCILNKYEDKEKAWEVFYEFYKDPDGYPLESHKYKTIDGVKCTCDALLSVKRIKDHEGFNSNFHLVDLDYCAGGVERAVPGEVMTFLVHVDHGGGPCDALLSVKRIKDHEGFNSNFVETFKNYRSKPIFFFPCEIGGLNTSRYNKFYDRIDHMLFDLKRKCEGKTDCRLENTYTKAGTAKWLEHFAYDFNKIVEWYGLENSFVRKENGKYRVFDLEKNDGTYIDNDIVSYSKSWT